MRQTGPSRRPSATDAGERVQVERHRLVRAEDAIEALDAALGDHLEAELQVVLDAEEFFEMIEDQRVEIVDLDRDRRPCRRRTPNCRRPNAPAIPAHAPRPRAPRNGNGLRYRAPPTTIASKPRSASLAEALGAGGNVGDEIGGDPDLGEVGALCRHEIGKAAIAEHADARALSARSSFSTSATDWLTLVLESGRAAGRGMGSRLELALLLRLRTAQPVEIEQRPERAPRSVAARLGDLQIRRLHRQFRPWRAPGPPQASGGIRLLARLEIAPDICYAHTNPRGRAAPPQSIICAAYYHRWATEGPNDTDGNAHNQRQTWRCGGADFETLWEGLDYAARGDAGFNFFTARGELKQVLTYRALRDQARDLAQRLAALGLARGERMVMIADTIRSSASRSWRRQYAGLVPVPVAIPTSLGGRAAYVAQLRHQIEGCGAKLAWAPDDLLPFLREAADGLALAGRRRRRFQPPCRRGRRSEALREGRVELPAILLGQHALPEGHRHSAERAAGQCLRDRAITACRCGSGDRCSSWLPFYHDMGLVGFMLTPILNQLSVDYLTTRDFARRSLTWLNLISEYGGTLAYSPSFGYDLCVRRLRDGTEFKAISPPGARPASAATWYSPQCCSASPMPSVPFGFRETAFCPSYGMAETTLAMSFAPLEELYTLDHISRAALERDRAEPARAWTGFPRLHRQRPALCRAMSCRCATPPESRCRSGGSAASSSAGRVS